MKVKHSCKKAQRSVAGLLVIVDDASPAQTTKPEISLDGTGKKAIGLTRTSFALDSAAYAQDYAADDPKTGYVSTNITVSSDTMVSKGGTRRVMVKLDVPYQALASETGVSSLSEGFSPTRSGKMISLHAVLTVPKEVVQDMRGANGTAVANVAAAQIDYLRALLAQALLPKAVMVWPSSDESGTTSAPIYEAFRARDTAQQADAFNRGIMGLTPYEGDDDIDLKVLPDTTVVAQLT